MAKKKVNVGNNSEIRVIWDVNVLDHSEEKEANIRTLVAKKYGLPESKVHVESNIYSLNDGGVVSLNKDTIQDMHDPKFQQSMYEPYFKERGITDYDMEEILKIDSQINALIDYDSYEKGRKYTLKWLDWDNFLSYGPSNHVDFSDFKGLILLNSIPANQGGKSTFAYDLLHFLFFGKTRSGKMDTLADLFNDNIPEATTVKVEGCLCIDGVDYVIRRTLTRPSLSSKSKNRAVTQKVEYFRVLGNGNMEELADVENLAEENNVKTSKAIKEAIGNERDFDMVISANADNLKSLISLKDTDRGRLLTRWIGLLPLEDKDAKAREKWNKEISANRYCNRYNRETLKAEIELYETQNTENEKQIKKQDKIVSDSQKKIEKFNTERDTLIQSKKNIDPNLTNVDVTTLEAQIATITQNGINTKARKDAEQQKFEGIGELPIIDEALYKSNISERDSIIEEIANIKAQINTLKSANISLEKSEYCPTCGRKFENVDNTAKITENTSKIQELINTGIERDKRKKQLISAIEAVDVLRAQHIEKNKIELLISKYNVELANLRNELIEKRQLKKDIEANISAIEENNRIDVALNLVNQNIKSEEYIRDTAKQTSISLQKDIETNKAAITDRKVIIAKIEEEEKVEKNWKQYLMLVGKDGISKMVLRNTLPIINSELKRLLTDVCNFDVEVRMDDNNDVEFKLIMKTTGRVRRLAAGSGLEQTAAALALRVVLGNMSALSKPPFLLLDEVLGGVADENYENLRKLYQKISDNYTFVFQITHLKQIWEWHNKTVTIIKDKNEISHVEIN